MTMPRSSRTSKPPNAPTMPKKPKSLKEPKSNGKRPAKSKALPPNKAQHVVEMLGQLDAPLPGAVPGTADSDEGDISEGSASRPNATTTPGAAGPSNASVFSTAGSKDMITEGSSSQPDAAAPDSATPSHANGNNPTALDEREYKDLGRSEDQNGTAAQIRRIGWNDGLLTGFLDSDGDDVIAGFDTLHHRILKFVRFMTKTVDWGSLDVETQQMLKSWAPKAKEYLEIPRGAGVLFQGWLWRTVVDDIFGGPGDQPHWASYNELLHVIEPLANLTPDVLRTDQKETNFHDPLWRTVVAGRLKNRHLLWRILTVELLRSARGGAKFRYNFESVVGLFRQKFGRWLRLVENEEDWKTLNRAITEIAEAAIELDWYVHCDERTWEFSFTDPESGQAHGFLYKNRPYVQPHFISSDPKRQEGYPVDFVVTPSLRYQGNMEKPAEDWDEPCLHTPMQVVIDMLPDEDEEDTVDGGGNSAGPSANKTQDGVQDRE